MAIAVVSRRVWAQHLDMNILVHGPGYPPNATPLQTDEALIVELADGRSLSVPLTWYPRLLHGSPAERQNWQLLGDGYAIEWPDLDEHIGLEGLLTGRSSGESHQSFTSWLASRN
jgi:hypothetical protein